VKENKPFMQSILLMQSLLGKNCVQVEGLCSDICKGPANHHPALKETFLFAAVIKQPRAVKIKYY
jgi:hypothetical protein